MGVMKPNKYLLFIGLFFICVGILNNILNGCALLGYFIICVGGGLKGIYLYQLVKAGKIKLGSELYFLGIGLLLLFVSQFLKWVDLFETLLKVLFIAALVLKSIFVVLIIVKSRKKV